MSTRRLIPLLTAAAMWLGGAAHTAHAGVIPSESASTVTLSIFDTNGQDITETYVATWSPTSTPSDLAARTVYIRVNDPGATLPPNTAPVLVTDPIVETLPLPARSTLNPFRTAQITTTSRYPGNCTNYGDSTDTSPDFEPIGAATTIPGAITGYPLVSKDCGGIAVVQVGSHTFVLPRDLDRNGIPDVLQVFGVALVPGDDNDIDGVSNLDELRGFIISGQLVRGNPTIKDLLVHLVRPQCGSSSLLGAVYPSANSGALDSSLRDLIPVSSASESQIRFLGSSLPSGNSAATLRTAEWVDHFSQFEVVGSTETWTYCTDRDCANNSTTFTVTTSSGTPPAEDRVINKNRAYGVAQKGLRLTECLDTSLTSPFGTARWGSATGGRDEAVVYTKRIENYVNSQGSASATIYYSTFNNLSNTWTALSPTIPNSTASVTRAFIASKIIQYIIAMEIGHAVKLNHEALSTTFPHYTAGTGNNLDASFRVSTKGSPTGVKWWIPSTFSAADQGLVTLTP